MPPIKVFIFEDEWMVREALISIIEKSDCGLEIVGESDNADRGCKAALEAQPDVVLMDLRLRGNLNGIDAMRQLIAQQPLVKTIIFTSYPDEDTLRSALNSGAHGYLLKREVTNSDMIIHAIREVYAGHSYLTPAMTSTVLRILKNSKPKNDFKLTEREIEILGLIAEGKSNKQIAGTLGIEERTVANHVSRILEKTEANNRTDAIVRARDAGIINGH